MHVESESFPSGVLTCPVTPHEQQLENNAEVGFMSQRKQVPVSPVLVGNCHVISESVSFRV